MRFDFPPFPRYAARSVASSLSGFHVRDFLRLFIPPFVASLLRVALYAMWRIMARFSAENPLRALEWSSSKIMSSTQCSGFSTSQCERAACKALSGSTSSDEMK